MANILMIDAFDSFTYNLVNLLKRHAHVSVLRTDAADYAAVSTLSPDAIVLSPGPGSPKGHDYLRIIRDYYAQLPILGICMGHQAILHYHSIDISEAKAPLHGKVRAIIHEQQHEFSGLPQPMNVMQYNSLVAKTVNCTQLDPTAWTEEGELMAFKSPELKLTGFQFHPESILTPQGAKLIENWWRGVQAFAA